MIKLLGTASEPWTVKAVDMTSDGEALYDLSGQQFTAEDLIALAAFLLRRENRLEAESDLRVLVEEFTRGHDFTEIEE